MSGYCRVLLEDIENSLIYDIRDFVLNQDLDSQDIIKFNEPVEIRAIDPKVDTKILGIYGDGNWVYCDDSDFELQSIYKEFNQMHRDDITEMLVKMRYKLIKKYWTVCSE